MTMFQIYRMPIRQAYRASLASKATIFQVVSLILTIVCPLLVAYRSQGFWLKTNTYREQPNVHFKHQFLILVKTENVGGYFLWSSFPGLNYLEASHLRIPVINSQEIDENRDGKYDKLEFRAKFPLDTSEAVVSVSSFLIFDYQISLYSRFTMESMVHIDEESRVPASKIAVTGDLKLFQRIPLWYRGRDDRFNQPVINISSPRAQDFAISQILAKYFGRNVTTKLEPKIAVWTPAPKGINEFRVDVSVNYVTETVQYYAGFWELIKWGWIQYLSVLLVFIFVFGRIREFVFGNRLLLSVPEKVRYYG